MIKLKNILEDKSISKPKAKRDNCRKELSSNLNGEWLHCSICGGRSHKDTCTTIKNPRKDCCYKRHMDLLNLGIVCGINDSSQAMDYKRIPPEGVPEFYTSKEEQEKQYKMEKDGIINKILNKYNSPDLAKDY